MSAVAADTHSLLWYLNDSAKLSPPALFAFENAERKGLPIYVSAIILIELRYLVEKGRDIFESDYRRIVGELDNPNSALTFLPLNQETCENLNQISRVIVPDMPDRILAATALTLGLPLISKDNKIGQLTNIQVIW